MRVVALVLLLAIGVVIAMWRLSGDGTPRPRTPGSTGRRADPSEPVPERHGFLSCALRIETAAGAPAAGAQVSYEGPACGSARAGEDGEVRVEGLARGFYTLRARLGAEAATLSFDLRQTEHLGTLRLEGTVSISGTVFDAQGRPLFGAVVEAVLAGEPAARNLTEVARMLAEPDGVATWTSTEGDGAYELPVAAGRSYAVRATCKGFAVARSPAVRVTADATVDFHLRSGVPLAGRVVDDRGFGVWGAHVLVSDPATLANGGAKAETVTAGDGSFELVIEPVQVVGLVVRADGFAPCVRRPVSLPAEGLLLELERGFAARLRVVAEEDPSRGLPGVSVAIDLQGGFALGITDADGALTLSNLPSRRRAAGGDDLVLLWGADRAFRMQPITDVPREGVLALGDIPLGAGGTVTGRVVRERDDAPVPGASVRVFGGVPPALAQLALPTIMSEADGSFELRGVPLDATHVFALHPEFEPPDDLAGVLSGRTAAGGGLLFPAGEDHARRDIVLRPAGTVTGIVTDRDGRPVAGARVEVVDPIGRATAKLGAPGAGTSSGEDGRFSLRVGGRSLLVATHASLRSVPVQADSGVEVTLVLDPLRTLKGRCVDEQRRPVAGARVALSPSGAPAGAPPLTVTDAEGRFALSGIDEERGEIRIEHAGYLVTKSPFDLPPGQSEGTLAPITLVRGPGIRGQVVDEAGRPVAEVTIAVSMEQGSAEGGRFWGEARTDAEGRFEIHGLAEGLYRVLCRDTDFVAEAPPTRTDGDEVRVVLREAASLHGRVVSGGEPVADAQVELRAGSATWSACTTREGTFLIPGLPPDTPLDVDVRHDAFRPWTSGGISSSTRGLSIVLEPGLRVGGTVALPDGTPVPGALVEIAAGASELVVSCDARGAFLAGGLPDGEIRVQVLESGLGLLPSDAVVAIPGEEQMHLVAERGESITGMVRLADGSPASGVRVLALRQDGSVAASAWIDRAGQGFVLRGLAPGIYSLRAERDGRPKLPAAEGALPNVAAGSSGVDLRLEEK